MIELLTALVLKSQITHLASVASIASVVVHQAENVTQTQVMIDPTLVQRAEDVMAGLEAVRGQFTQTNWDGTRQSGQFALQKPGKMRFDYDDKSLSVIADGITLSLTDNALETTDSVPLVATPLGAILSGKEKFRDTTNVQKTHVAGAYFYVSLTDKGDDWAGVLTLKFNNSDNRLAGWVTLDEAGSGTQVDLSDVNYTPKLNPRLFIIED